MWKYFTQHNTKKSVDILEDATFNYNHSINRSIKMMPVDVNKESEDKVWLTLYGDMKAGEKKTKFQLGEVVRVEKYYAGTRFKKGYEKSFTKSMNYL